MQLCDVRCGAQNNWMSHVTGKKHNKVRTSPTATVHVYFHPELLICFQKCLETLHELGLEQYKLAFGTFPLPQGAKLLETMGLLSE